MKEIRAKDYKAKILAKIAPVGFNAFAFANDLHMIKPPAPGHSTARVMTRDGGWVELDSAGKTVRTWGHQGRAQILAAALAERIGVEVEYLAKTAGFGAVVDTLKGSKHSEDQIKDLASWWTERGYTATTAPDGCWINVGRARLHDAGSRISVHGALTEEAIAATILKAKESWGGSMVLTGSWTQGDKDRLWIAAQRDGIDIVNCEPSRTIQETWQREQESADQNTRTISAARSAIADAADLRDAAGGDLEALNRLPGPLQAFVASYLDDDKRKELSAQSVADITAELKRFRHLGDEELAEYERTGRQFITPKPRRRDHDRDNEKNELDM